MDKCRAKSGMTNSYTLFSAFPAMDSLYLPVTIQYMPFALL